MSLPPSPGSPASPSGDRAALLLEAVRRRDGWATAQLLRRWVHRHGVASLEHFCHTDLHRLEGPEAVGWLLQRIESPLEPASFSASAPAPAVPAPAPEAPPREEPLPEPVPTAADPLPVSPPVEPLPLPVAAAPPPEPEAPVPPPAGFEAAEAGGLPGDEVGAAPVSAGEPSVRLEVAAIDPWLSPAERPSVPDPAPRAAIADDSLLDVPEDPLAAAPEPAEQANGAETEADEEVEESVPISTGLRRLGRLGSLMWNSLESLGRGRERSEEEIEESDPDAGPDEPQDPRGSHDPVGSGEEAPAFSSSPLEAWPAPAAAAAAERSPLPPESGSPAPAEASLPPRPAGHRPAPAPAPLQDLRAWLPDGDDAREFPRAS